MNLSELQQQCLSEMEISSWVPRHTHKAAVESPSSTEREELKDQVHLAKAKYKTQWFIVSEDGDFPAWWEKFLQLFTEHHIAPNEDSNIEYRFKLHFSSRHQTLSKQDNAVLAPALIQFDEQLKQQLWKEIKPWLGK